MHYNLLTHASLTKMHSVTTSGAIIFYQQQTEIHCVSEKFEATS